MRLKKHIQRKKHWNFRVLFRKHVLAFKRIAVLFMFIVGISFLLNFIFRSSYFSISSVEVSGPDKFVSLSDVHQIIFPNINNKNILLLNSKNISEELESTFLGAETIIINKHMPSTIKIVIVERTPIAVVHNTAVPNDFFLVDHEGYVLGYVNPLDSSLPIIDYHGELKVGLFIDKELVPIYLQVDSLLAKEDINATSMSFKDAYITVFTRNGTEVVLSKEKDISKSVGTLSVILKKFSLEDRHAKKIDLRYDKVIVLFSD